MNAIGPVGIGRMAPVSEFAFGSDDGDLKTILYSVRKLGDPDKALQFRLWYNPNLLQPIKCLVSSSDGSELRRFQEFTLNADIPDEKFKLPAEKK